MYQSKRQIRKSAEFKDSLYFWIGALLHGKSKIYTVVLTGSHDEKTCATYEILNTGMWSRPGLNYA